MDIDNIGSVSDGHLEKKERWVSAFYHFCDELVYGRSSSHNTKLHRLRVEIKSAEEIDSARVQASLCRFAF